MKTATQKPGKDQSIGFISESELMAERQLRKRSAARLKALQDQLAAHGVPPRQNTVPHEALHAEKERRRFLEARIEELEAEVADLRSRLADAAR